MLLLDGVVGFVSSRNVTRKERLKRVLNKGQSSLPLLHRRAAGTSIDTDNSSTSEGSGSLKIRSRTTIFPLQTPATNTGPLNFHWYKFITVQKNTKKPTHYYYEN